MGYLDPTRCNVYDIEAERQFTFQFIPETISDSKGSNWATYNIQGRSSPLRGYSSGPSRTIRFTAVMFVDPVADGTTKSLSQIKQDVDFLLSLPYPDYSGGLKPPHKCLVNIGDIVQGFQAVCTNAQADYIGSWPWEPGPGLPHGVRVSLEFAEVQDSPLDTLDRRGGKHA